MKRLCILLLALLLVSGCGTIQNVQKGFWTQHALPYGGVAIDIAYLGTPFLPIAFIDLPLSFVGDTVTLPYVLIQQSLREKKKTQTQKQKEEKEKQKQKQERKDLEKLESTP